MFLWVCHIFYSSKIEPSLFFFCSSSCLWCPYLVPSLYNVCGLLCCKGLLDFSYRYLVAAFPLFLSKLFLSFLILCFLFSLLPFVSFTLKFVQMHSVCSVYYYLCHFFLTVHLFGYEFSCPLLSVFCSEGCSVNFLPLTSFHFPVFPSLFPGG